MQNTYTFHPPRWLGTIVHYLSILLLTLAGLWGIWQISQASVGPQIILYLFVLLAAVFSVPILLYRYYALRNSSYTLTREGIQLQWGWRKETIPMNAIQWIHPVYDLETKIQPPRVRWPGAVLGTRKLARGPAVEFMASRQKDVLVLAAENHYYAISPQNVNKFLAAFHDLSELGALQRISYESTRSTALVTQIWQQKSAFYTILSGFVLNLTLLIWTLFTIPNRPQVSLGFTSQGLPHEPLDSVRLILLPILNTLSFLANFIVGLFLFRSDQNKLLAYLLWGSSILIGLILHTGVYFITR